MVSSAASKQSAKLAQATRCCFFLLMLFACGHAAAQTRGKVTVVKDALVDTLIAKRAILNKANNNIAAGSFSGMGYRVQFFNGVNRKDAYNAQARFQQKYPSFRTYISFRDPDFIVHGGDFRTRIEAEKLVQELRPTFKSLFIISEKINTPKADNSND